MLIDETIGDLLLFGGILTMFSSILWFYLDKYSIGIMVILLGFLLSIGGLVINAPKYQVECSNNGETVFMETSYNLPKFDKYDECTIKTLY